MFTLIKKDGRARRGRFETPHGTIETPVFMNVATCGAIKGGLGAEDLREVNCQVMLSNTYHLHVRPGDTLIHDLGGIRKLTGWSGPVLTDSGGFQVFSLSQLRRIKEEGVYFSSHVDGRHIFMGPEESMRIQSNLASTIAMAFDECIENPAEYNYTKRSCERTARWLERCKAEMQRLNSLETAINPKQMLFGINQGSTYEDLRIEHMKRIAELDLDGYAIGGLAVGEEAEEMYRICLLYTSSASANATNGFFLPRAARLRTSKRHRKRTHRISVRCLFIRGRSFSRWIHRQGVISSFARRLSARTNADRSFGFSIARIPRRERECSVSG